jgi:hypothetical protein
MRRALILAAALTAFCGACTKTESTSVLTRGVSADLNVGAYGNGDTIAFGRLKVGETSSSNYLDLQGDDTLFAINGTQNLRMTKSEFLGLLSYRTTFKGLDREDTPFRISFSRSVDSGAPNSTCTLPAPFTLTSSRNTASIAGEDIVVNWASSGTPDKMRWSASGTCVSSAGGGVTGDPGSLTIPRGTLKQRDTAKPPQSCELTIEVFRERSGQLDPAYGKGGSVNCYQSRSVKLSGTP